MKFSKPNTNPPFTQASQFSKRKASVIQHRIEIENLRELLTCRVRNLFSHRITDFCYRRPSASRRLIRNNAKYLRSYSSALEGLHTNLRYLKISNSIRKIDILDLDDTPAESKSPQNTIPMSLKAAKRAMRLTLKNKRLLDQVEIKVSMLNCLSKWSIYEISRVKRLSVKKETLFSSQIYTKQRSALQQRMEIDRMFPKVKHFTCLTSFYFSSTSLSSSQEFFMEIFQRVSDLESLASLKIELLLDKLPKRNIKMKEIMKKFTNLTNLTLALEFQATSQCGGLFTSLQPLDNLRCLVLEITSEADLDCTDMASFIGSLKSLTVLKFISTPLLFNGYNHLLDGIQKLKTIKELSIQQLGLRGNTSSFAYGKIFKTISGFSLLEELDVQLPRCSQDQKEMNGFLVCLQKHPTLKKANISLVTNLKQKYKFDEQFFSNVTSAVDALEKFQVHLYDFPQDVAKRVSQTVGLKYKKTPSIC